jgi:CheY-like chemotaxis protein
VVRGLPKVLVVEDDVDTQAALREFLQYEGFEVTVAGNGTEVINTLQDLEPPCAMLVDLTMPGIVGEEVVEYMRGESGLASIPVAIVSASPDRAPAGVRVFKKPVDIDALIAFLKDKCLSKSA